MVLGYVEPIDDLPVDDDRATAGNGPNCKLLVARQAKLADDQHVERGPQPQRHLIADRHPTARKSEDDDIRLARPRRQRPASTRPA